MSIQKTYEATLIRVTARENDRAELMTGETAEWVRFVPSNVTNGENYLAIVTGDGSIYDFYTGDTGTVQLSDIENDISEKLENDGDTVSVAIEYRDFFHMLAKDNKELIDEIVMSKHFKFCGINRTKKLIKLLNTGEIDYIKGFVFFHMVSSEEVVTSPKVGKDKKVISNETKNDSTEFESTVLRVVFIDGRLLTINGTILEGYKLMVPGNKRPGESFLVSVTSGKMLYEEVATEEGVFKLSDIINSVRVYVNSSLMHDILEAVEKYKHLFEQLFEHNEKLIEEHVKPMDYERAGIIFERNSNALASSRFNYVKGYVFLKLVNEGKLVTKPMEVIPDSNNFTNMLNSRDMGQPRFDMERGGHYNFIPRNNTHGVDTPYGLINEQLNEESLNCGTSPWNADKRMGRTTINVDGTAFNKQRTTLESLLKTLDNDLKLPPDINNPMKELSATIKEYLITFDKEQRTIIEEEVRAALHKGDKVTITINSLVKDLYTDNDGDVAIMTTRNGQRFYSEKLNTVPLKAISNIVATKKIY